jgi:hypothetical protein
MWIVGLLVLLLVLGFRKFILVMIGWFVLAYIGFLVATFCPILLVPVVGYGLLKYVGLL